ncbi:aminoglycoside phosphotransferase family protein [Robertmurraya kyonggiensis]|uniref:Aminoglycoside phosphotransferase family protein n=1 Tax=Robertmurraya kyonggiensis TaxID=1037680 RepID=A0A4U1DB97_9BACI|nr:aminoglycoside phosphotransferase family protein [Robertmurraya kyonggiensis]TKC18877.1 aminoglycoside phosphotransferase family protein [Robertmurraya kyonggiensis]
MTEKERDSIEKIFGQIYEINKLSEQGCTSEVRKILTESGTYLLKSSFYSRYREWLRMEALVLEKLTNQHAIPVPRYFGFFEDEKSSHLVMSFEKGTTLTTALKNAKSQIEKLNLIRSFGEFLNRLHETNIPESLYRENDWLEEQLIRAEKYLHEGQTEGTHQLLEQLQSTKLHPVSQTIIHGDCTTDNVLVIDGKVSFFIDVSGMTAGDPRYDESLAIGCFDDESHIKMFYQGYRRYQVSKEESQYFNEGLYEFF